MKNHFPLTVFRETEMKARLLLDICRDWILIIQQVRQDFLKTEIINGVNREILTGFV